MLQSSLVPITTLVLSGFGRLDRWPLMNYVVQGLTTAANSIYVRVADNCPCVQYDADTGAETGVNAPCCGNVNHFDLSYFAFEKIAHPVRLSPDVHTIQGMPGCSHPSP